MYTMPRRSYCSCIFCSFFLLRTAGRAEEGLSVSAAVCVSPLCSPAATTASDDVGSFLAMLAGCKYVKLTNYSPYTLHRPRWDHFTSFVSKGAFAPRVQRAKSPTSRPAACQTSGSKRASCAAELRAM